MSHNIATLNGKSAMMYVGEVPWHGLGTPLTEPPTAAEAIKAAQLDWDVTKVPLHIRAGDSYNRLTDKFAIVSADTLRNIQPKALGVVGLNYTPLQNRDAFRWFDPIMKVAGAAYHTAGALGEGERVWILAKLPEDIRVVGDDIAQKFLLLSNSHDGQSSVQIKFTPIRVVCQNTLTLALSQGQGLRVPHTPSLPLSLKRAEERLLFITARFKEIKDNFQRMARVSMIENRLDQYLTEIFPDPRDEADERAMNRVRNARTKSHEQFEVGRGNTLPEVRGTLWAAYNGVAEFVDYYTGSRSPGKHLDSIWFGDGYLAKARAYHLAVKKANVWN